MIPLLLLAAVGAFAFVLLVKLLWAKTQPSTPTVVVTFAAAALIVALALSLP